MKLTTKTIEFLKESIRARTLLALALGKHVDTIERWIKSNDAMLTTASALQVIREESGMSDADILIDENAHAA